MRRLILVFCFMTVVVLGINTLDAADEQADGIFNIHGTVKHFSYQGGFYGIEGDDGKTYKPVDMTSNFKVEGARVKISAKPIEKKLLLSGWGIPIKILKIEREWLGAETKTKIK